MKETSKTKFGVKSIFKRHWSNILFFGIILLFLIPSSRVFLQTKIAYIFSTSPAIIEKESRQKLSDYNLVLKNVKNETVNLSQSKNKPVLINFWATWCAPCLAELPDLSKLYEDHKDEIDFYFISKEEPIILERFLKSKVFNLPVYAQISKLPFPLENSSLPTTYLIDKNGNIVAFANKTAKWNDEKIKTLIKKM
jgi:thiol-disulfide isomerase/thioredoxin